MASINCDPENAALSAAAVEREAPEWEDRQFGITLDGRDRCDSTPVL